MSITTANGVANFLLRYVQEKGDLITNLKLQKLVYYAQAWYLALYDEPLFDDHFEAWVHGPVQPQLYRRFKKYRWNYRSEHPKDPKLQEDVVEHLKEVFDVYSRYSAYELELIGHRERPWKEVREGLNKSQRSSKEITQESMMEYYKELTDAEEEE